MATNFPTSIDSFTNPSSGDTLDSPSHAAQHTNINDAMVAVQTKLGAGSGTIGTWTAYTPTLTNWTASTLGFEYARVNDLVFIKIYAVVATMGTIPTFSVPIPIGGTPNYQSMGILDAGAAWYQGNVLYNNSTSLNMWYLNSSGGAGIYGIITALAPFTWAPGDAFEGTIYYKAA